jgi:hypothetical protein
MPVWYKARKGAEVPLPSMGPKGDEEEEYQVEEILGYNEDTGEYLVWLTAD